MVLVCVVVDVLVVWVLSIVMNGVVIGVLCCEGVVVVCAFSVVSGWTPNR